MEEILLLEREFTHSEMEANDVLPCVVKIDDYIDKESVEIMKLSMRLELSQSELETAKCPSDLFHALSKHYDNLEVVLARFMYALKILGHRRYGQRAIRELEQLQQNPEPYHPATDIRLKHDADLDGFYLHQCLALACRMVPSGDSSDRFINHFANILGINPNAINTPSAIITKLIEKGKISAKNQLTLMEEALVVSQLSDSQVRDYTENCKRINCSQWIASRSNSSTTINTRSIGVGTETLTKGYVNARIQGFAKSLCMWSWIWFLLSIPIYGVIYLSSTEASHTLTQYSSNSTVIIANSSSSKVVQDARHHGDYEHKIQVYQVNCECEKLPAGNRKYTITGSNDFSSINGTTIYALAGSYITLNVCGSTNSTNYLPRLEVAVVESLEALHSTDTMFTDVSDFNFFYPKAGGEWSCKNVTFNIDHFGYYTLVFPPQPEETVFNFSATYYHRFLDINLLSVKISYTLSKDQDEWHLPKTLWFNKKLCFVAAIKDNPNAPMKNVHIRRSYKSGRSYTVGQHVVVIGTVVDFFVIMAVICYCVRSVRKWIKHN